MPICASAVQQTDGSYFLALDLSQTNIASCQYVVHTGSEAGGSILSLSMEDGGLISAAIVSCWALAYGIKSIINILKGTTNA